MLKAYIFLVLWLIVACNCRSLETRARISTNNEDEHVHIKVLLPKVLRKHKVPRHTIRPHYPKHYEAISRPKFPPNEATSMTQSIFSQHHDDNFELPSPMPMLTSEHEILAHIAATAPLAENDISHNQSIRTQRQKQKRKRTPTMWPPPPPVPLSPPMMAQNLYDSTKSNIFSSTLLDGNVLTADEFLREMQQLYAQKYGATMTPTLMMQPQTQPLTKTTTTTSTSTPTTTSKKNPKKRKHNKNDYNSNNYNNKFHFSKPANSQQYYAKEAQQQQQQLNLQQGFKPYSSNQAYSNYYHYYDDYNNNDFFDNKKTTFSIIDETPMGAKELSTDDITDDIDANSSSTEDYTSHSVSDTVMAFSAPIHPEEPSSFLASSPYSIANNMQINNNNNNYDSYGGYGFDDDDDNNNNNNDNDDFNPISYQDLYATYSATPAAHHLSTMPTRLKIKRQQLQGQPFREQFVQLSSIAPVVSTGINTLRSTQREPTTTTTSTMGDIGNIYGVAQQPLERYRKQQKRIKVKRNRLMVQ